MQAIFQEAAPEAPRVLRGAVQDHGSQQVERSTRHRRTPREGKPRLQGQALIWRRLWNYDNVFLHAWPLVFRIPFPWLPTCIFS